MSAAWEWRERPAADGELALEGALTRDWYQGRGVFGGVQAAALLDAMARLSDRLHPGRPPRTLTVRCLAPATEGAARVVARVDRAGGKVLHLSATLRRVAQQGEGEGEGEGELIAAATATFGLARESGLTHPAEPAPPAPPPEEVREVPPGLPLMPRFTQHLSFRFCLGAPPYARAATPELGGWCDLRAPHNTRPLDFPTLALLLDAWPPAHFASLSAPMAAASVEFSYHFLVTDPAALERPLLFKARSMSAVDGYSEERGWLWDRAGRPVAVARQLVALG